MKGHEFASLHECVDSWRNTMEAQEQAVRQQILEVLDGRGTRKIPVAVFEQRFPDIVLPQAEPPK